MQMQVVGTEHGAGGGLEGHAGLVGRLTGRAGMGPLRRGAMFGSLCHFGSPRRGCQDAPRLKAARGRWSHQCSVSEHRRSTADVQKHSPPWSDNLPEPCLLGGGEASLPAVGGEGRSGASQE